MIWAYLKYLIRSSNRNKITEESVSSIFRREVQINGEVRKYSAKLKISEDIINFQDFGAGSKKFKTNKRKVKDVAKTSGTPLKYTAVLMNICAFFEDCRVLELGTSLGIGTLSLSLNSKSVDTIEGDKETYNYTKNQLQDYSNIKFVHSLFDEHITQINSLYDVIFIDGNHSKIPTITYCKELIKNTKDGSYIIFDDINWSSGMQEAWNEIKSLNNFDLTIDIFKFGIVRIGKDPAKHYIIRY